MEDIAGREPIVNPLLVSNSGPKFRESLIPKQSGNYFIVDDRRIAQVPVHQKFVEGEEPQDHPIWLHSPSVRRRPADNLFDLSYVIVHVDVLAIRRLERILSRQT